MMERLIIQQMLLIVVFIALLLISLIGQVNSLIGKECISEDDDGYMHDIRAIAKDLLGRNADQEE